MRNHNSEIMNEIIGNGMRWQSSQDIKPAGTEPQPAEKPEI